MEPVDVVTIGVGLTGSLAALELAKEGLKVVGLERGAPRYTVPDFQSPAIHGLTPTPKTCTFSLMSECCPASPRILEADS